MTETVTLHARPRTIVGKQVRALRREGSLPANIYGRGLESLAIETDAREFSRFIRSSAVRGMFQLAIEGESAPRHVILRALARKGGTGEPIHADFFQVDLQRPVQTTVPIRLSGQAPAVRDLAGTLVQSLETIQIRCLPLEIPEAIDADLGILKSFASALTVDDLELDPSVQVLTPPSMLIASVAPPRIRRA